MSGPIDCAQLDHDVNARYDAIVVGSGAGGAVLAKELAEGGLKVAIVEEGAHHRQHRDLAFDAIGRLYRDKGLTSTLGNPIIPVPMGKCFGGTTVINSGTCFRAPERVLRDWRERLQLPLELGDAYARVERELNVEPSDFAVMSRSNTIVHELLAREGLRGAPLLRNVKACEGCGMCCYGCDSGAKQSMDVSYLPKTLKAGATAYTQAKVSRVVVSGGRARGVEAHAVDRRSRRTGVRLRLEADRVIVAAGTFFTPQLLRASGIRNGHLGKHLTLHPATKVLAEFDEDVRGWDGTPQAYYYDGFHGEGIMFEGIFTPPDMAGMVLPFVGRRLTDFMKRYSKMASFGFLISDESEGRLAWLPLLGWSYLYSLTSGDVKRIQRGAAFLARVFLKGGAKRVIPMVRGWEFASLADVDRFEAASLRPSDIDCMAFHPLGTCRMSVSPADGVCGPDHAVHGTPGLYVCDGSVVPSSLGVNPQMTIMALATRLAGELLGKRLG